VSLLNELPKYWIDGALRNLDDSRRGLNDGFPLHEDPPAATPYEVVYEGSKVRLRHYQAVGKPLTGQIFRETVEDLFRNNLLLQGRFQIGGQPVNMMLSTPNRVSP